MLSLEDSGSRMTRLGEAALFQQRLLSVDEVLERLDAVTAPDVHALARDVAIVGRVRLAVTTLTRPRSRDFARSAHRPRG